MLLSGLEPESPGRNPGTIAAKPQELMSGSTGNQTQGDGSTGQHVITTP